jgi:chromosome segregation ATPase
VEELRKKAGVNAEERPGVIVNVLMENFMNQKKFAINFTPRVNFITGKNGAGKSAILTALVVALGASARQTHRAKKMSSFIRRGHEGSAYIEVTLQNCGPEAFRSEVYGSTIGKTTKAKEFRKTLGTCKVPTLTIIRTISRSGATTYGLRDTNGVKIKPSQLKYGSYKNEVDQIIDVSVVLHCLSVERRLNVV